MNPNNNPLLNRLFETRSNKRKKLNQSKQEPSMKDNREKVLVPKLAAKNMTEVPSTSQAEKQKANFIKINTVKLPPLQQKEMLSTTKKASFRERKVSWKEATSEGMIAFATQISIGLPNFEEKKQPQFFYSEKEIKKPKTAKFERVVSQTQQQLFEYLTVLQKNEELKQQFCYMNRGQLPYSYYIVDYQNVNKKQFLTVSLRGVSIYKEGEPEFTTVEKLSREIQIYRKVKQIQFFRDYLAEKTLKHWRYKTVRRKFEGQCRIISKNLLSQNLILQKYHQFLYGLVEDFCRCKFLDLRIASTGSISALKQELNQKELSIEKSILYFQQQIQTCLKQSIEKSMTKFKHEERVSLTSDGKEVGEDSAYLPYDSKKKTMKYTQMAKLKQFEASMYRLIKMTDLIRFTTKTCMIKDGLDSYVSELVGLHDKYAKRKQASFVSWVHMKVKLTHESSDKAVFLCEPSVGEIRDLLNGHLVSILQKFYRHNFLLIERKDSFYCQSYDPLTEEHPSKLDLKYFIESNKQTVDKLIECEQKLQFCLNDIQTYLKKANSILQIYNQSLLNSDVNDFMQNEVLKEYLESAAEKRGVLNSWEPTVEFGLVNLDMNEALVSARTKFEQKFKFISNAIPNEVVRRCESLAEQVRSVYNKFKENPGSIMQFISFVGDYHEERKKLEAMERKIESILELEDMVYKNGLRIGQGSKIHISQCSAYFKELQKRFEQIQSNQEKEMKKTYKMIDDMVEPLDLRAEQLMKKLTEDSIVSSRQSEASKAFERLNYYEQEFSKIKAKKQQLFYYQKELRLGHKDLPNYFRLESVFEWTTKIWRGRSKYEQFVAHFNTRGYAQKCELSIFELKQSLADLETATAQLQLVDLLQVFRQDNIRAIKVMQMCQFLCAETLQDQHKKSIKDKMTTTNKKIRDYLFTIQGGRTILCSELVAETNLLEIKDFVQQVVFVSAQENVIKQHIRDTQQFWRKNRVAIVGADLSKNGTEILHFGRHENEKLMEKIGSYLMSFKNMIESKHSVGELQERIRQQLLICQYLKDLFEKWAEVEKQWVKLLPLMTNCPSVKHQSNVYFEFTSLDNSIRKHNRQMRDLSSLRRITEDCVEKKYLQLMVNCERDLREVNKIFNSFLEAKRNTYYRFFFLADQELITILENTKDARSLASYASYCFNCDKLVLDKELVSGFQSSEQMLKLRKVILKGEPDEMFKAVQENMKLSLKSSILALTSKVKFEKESDMLSENTLQAVLVADRLVWTEISEAYLNSYTFDSYELVLRYPYELLVKAIRKPGISHQHRHKIATRLVQSMQLKEIGEELVKLQTTKDDFKWKEQMKYAHEEEDIVVTQFNRKLVYGLEYYPPSRIIIPTSNYRLLLSKAHEACLTDKAMLVTGVEGDGKRNLMAATAREYGYYYKQLVCNKNISAQYVMRFVQGAVFSGAWLSFYEFEQLDARVLAQLLNEIQKVIAKLSVREEQTTQETQPSQATTNSIGNRINWGQQLSIRIPARLNPHTFASGKTVVSTPNSVMFSFITHGFSPERVSVYQFNRFCLSEPNHSKICEWLLMANNFAQWQPLTHALVSFLETVFPFLQRVMGSFMSILRKIIDQACLRKNSPDCQHPEMFLIADAFRSQILQKSDENVQFILYEALRDFFFYPTPDENLRAQGGTIGEQPQHTTSKVSTLVHLLSREAGQILVIGPRSCKTRAIRESCQFVGRQLMSIYPQASQLFFQEDTIERLNMLEKDKIIHYDAESMTREWNDLVISGYLFMEGKKIRLANQLIIELREVNDCSPSFVGSCNIVYFGTSSTKKERFLARSEAAACELIMEPITQIFGPELDSMPEHLVDVMAEYLKPLAKDPRSKNYHKLICWLASVLGVQNLWSRFYGGRYLDYTINKYSQELWPIDESRYAPFEQQLNAQELGRQVLTTPYLLVHTKNSIILSELFRNMLQICVPVLISGRPSSGKSTMLKLILQNCKAADSGSNHQRAPTSSAQLIPVQAEASEQADNSTPLQFNMSVRSPTNSWTHLIKSSLTNIRRHGSNFLVNVGDGNIIVAVDDLDLGHQSHREYLRQLIDIQRIYDDRLESYDIQRARVVCSYSRGDAAGSEASSERVKLFDRMVEIAFPQPSKESLATILQSNIAAFCKNNDVSKEVCHLLENPIAKSLAILFEDLISLSGASMSAFTSMAVLRNLLSIPRKNILMNAQFYLNYFRAQLKVRLMERCFDDKTKWQYNSVYENLNKVILDPLALKSKSSAARAENEQQIEQVLLCQERQCKLYPLDKLKQKIEQEYPELYIFKEMLVIAVKVSNQLNCIDSHCVLVGRTGTGKQTILKIAAFLNKMSIFTRDEFPQCILSCLKGQDCILSQSYYRRNFSRFIQRNRGMYFGQLFNCRDNYELEKFIPDEKNKKEFAELVSLIPNRQGINKVTQRLKQKLRSVLVLDSLLKYRESLQRYKELNRYFVCYIEEWPAEALVNISGLFNAKNSPGEISEPLGSRNDDYRTTIVENSKFFAQVFVLTNKSLQSFDEPSIAIKKFKTYLKIFQIMHCNRERQLRQKKQFYAKTHQKFNEAIYMISQWQSRVVVLKKQLEQAILKLDQELRINKMETMTFSKLYEEKAAEQVNLAKRNEQMTETKAQLQKKLKVIKKAMQNIQKILSSMQRSEMGELKKTYKSNRVVGFGLECLCILLGEQQTEKSVNKILADSNLMMKMKSPAVLQHKNQRIVHKFQQQFESVKSEYEGKPKTDVSRILIDWIRAVKEYWEMEIEHMRLKQKLRAHKQEYDTSLSRQHHIEEEISGLKQKVMELNKDFEETFRKKQQSLSEYNKIASKLLNAKKIKPALTKSQRQTRLKIEQISRQLSYLFGNVVLSTVCLVYLPLLRLKIKKIVLDQVKKLLNQRVIEFSFDFMGFVTGVQDAVLEDLSLAAIKELEVYPILIVDPERRAMPYLFDQEPELAVTVALKELNYLSKKESSLIDIKKLSPKRVKAFHQDAIKIELHDVQTKEVVMGENEEDQRSNQDYIEQKANAYMERQNPIMVTNDENYKIILEKLPEDTFVIDWKYTNINASEKVFLKLAEFKRPEYFEAKKDLNRRIKKDLLKIQQLKKRIFEAICDKEISILDDEEFIDLGVVLMDLEVQTELNQDLEQQKIKQIQEYSKQINDEVTKVIYMASSLKKIKNVTLDLIIQIACGKGHPLGNIVKWAMNTLHPNKRLGWLTSVALDLVSQSNEELLAILIKETPLKMNEVPRNKKPLQMSNINFENLCKIAAYTPGLKSFAENAIKCNKQFEMWNLDHAATCIPAVLKPELLGFLETMVIAKVFKPQILFNTLMSQVKRVLKIEELEGYSNCELLEQTRKKYPIVAYCSLEHLRQLCIQLNESKLTLKSMVELEESLEARKFLWAQMKEENWVVLHSVYSRQAREMLEDMVEYVYNYDEQPKFRLFIYVDQVELSGFEDLNPVTTKYNNISHEAARLRSQWHSTHEIQLLSESKFIQNIGINIYEQPPSLTKSLLAKFKQLQGLTADPAPCSSPLQPQKIEIESPSSKSKGLGTQNPMKPPGSPVGLLGVLGSFVGIGSSEKEKVLYEKLLVLASMLETAAWIKYPKLRASSSMAPVMNLLKYMKQYSVPLQFNLHAVSSYLGRLMSGPLESHQRHTLQDLADRIIDETKVNDKSVYGLPIGRNALQLVLAPPSQQGARNAARELDLRMNDNYEILGCQQSYLHVRDLCAAQNALEVLGQITLGGRSARLEVPDIRNVLARMPASQLVFSRQFRNKLLLYCYMKELKSHNDNITAAAQFLQWINTASNQQALEEQTQGSTNKPTHSENFGWGSLIGKAEQLVGSRVSPMRIRQTLYDWVSNLKRRHQFLLYWNLDSPVVVLQPVLVQNFSMVVSACQLNYMDASYERVKAEAENPQQRSFYHLQVQFCRQTDLKEVQATEGVLLPELIYKDFKYNPELKMLGTLDEWNGEEPAPLVMLRMRKVPLVRNDTEEWPDIEIGVRRHGRIEVVYRARAAINGSFLEWSLRRPMLISE